MTPVTFLDWLAFLLFLGVLLTAFCWLVDVVDDWASTRWPTRCTICDRDARPGDVLCSVCRCLLRREHEHV
jgi:hypothetical protein